MSPALAGRFGTTEPPGKPWDMGLLENDLYDLFLLENDLYDLFLLENDLYEWFLYNFENTSCITFIKIRITL